MEKYIPSHKKQPEAPAERDRLAPKSEQLIRYSSIDELQQRIQLLIDQQQSNEAGRRNADQQPDELEQLQWMFEKFQAIVKNNPDLDERSVLEVAQSEVQEGRYYMGTFGLNEHSVVNKNPEIIKHWHEQVDELAQAVRTKDLEQLKKLVEQGRYQGDIGEIARYLQDKDLDEEAELLQAISLWVLREQGTWGGELEGTRFGYWYGSAKVAYRYGTKGSVTLESFLQENGHPSCYDSSLLVHLLAKSYGIAGSIQAVHKKPWAHRNWQSEKGCIVDVLRGHDTGGLFFSEEDYQERGKATELGRLGSS